MRRRPAGVPRAKWVRFFLDKLGQAPSKAQRTTVNTDDFLLSFEWRQLRMIVIKKRGRRCECCGATPADGVTVINVDHIKPRRDFPELALTESNLQILCNVCNHGKGNWDRTDWRAPDAVVDITDEQACRILERAFYSKPTTT